ncbi:hypothetical protein [Methylobacterium sp. P5_C11]
MPLSGPIALILRLGAAPPCNARVLVERTVETYVAGYGHPDECAIALDILLRDLARLRILEPDLDRSITEVERYIDGLHRDLARRAA